MEKATTGQNWLKGGEAVLIPGKDDFRRRDFIKDKGVYYIKIKWSVLQEGTEILLLYVPNHGI